MGDQSFYAPNRTIATRQPRPGERLWAIRKDGQHLACDLRDHGPWGVEVQIYREHEFLYGRRWATRALALEEADDQKRRISARAASSSRDGGTGMERSMLLQWRHRFSLTWPCSSELNRKIWRPKP
jgi:hypothetical protein